MRYALVVQYDGTHLSGFQRQKKGERTVQGELERAASEIFGTPTRVVGSGRTDAGVHALGQICHLDGDTTIPPQKLRECFNRLLPPDIRVLKSGAAVQGFDCTRGAKKKTYVYTAYFADTELPLLDRYAARLPALPALEAMRGAAELLVGEHDFKAFCAAGSSAKTSTRTIYSLDVERSHTQNAEVFRIRVTGNGFLYNMVRILAGELIQVGCGKSTEGIERALRTGERSVLAKTMPAKGLLLENVDYGTPLFSATEEE